MAEGYGEKHFITSGTTAGPTLRFSAWVNSIMVCGCQAGGLKNLNVYFPNHIRCAHELYYQFIMVPRLCSDIS